METSNPVRSSIALAVTVGIGYAACTVLFWAWPDQAAGFMNGLFHGLDFRKLQAGSSLFSFDAFLYALVILMAWALGLGFIYAWTKSKLVR